MILFLISINSITPLRLCLLCIDLFIRESPFSLAVFPYLDTTDHFLALTFYNNNSYIKRLQYTAQVVLRCTSRQGTALDCLYLRVTPKNSNCTTVLRERYLHENIELIFKAMIPMIFYLTFKNISS